MKCYGIAQTTHECYGHGDYGNEIRICPLGFYGTEGLPPVFMRREAAEQFVQDRRHKESLIVVTLELKP